MANTMMTQGNMSMAVRSIHQMTLGAVVLYQLRLLIDACVQKRPITRSAIYTQQIISMMREAPFAVKPKSSSLGSTRR